MAVVLDTGAIIALEEAFARHAHPLKEHLAAWTRDKVELVAPSPGWCEYWRGRGTNDHFIATLRRRVRVVPVDQRAAEAAADALRTVYASGDDQPVKHVIDAMVMAVADQYGGALYTGDPEDFLRLWDHFPRVKTLLDKEGAVLRRRA